MAEDEQSKGKSLDEPFNPYKGIPQEDIEAMRIKTLQRISDQIKTKMEKMNATPAKALPRKRG